VSPFKWTRLRTQVSCEGKGCVRTAGKDQYRPGWIVVTTYPLYEADDSKPKRLLLCPLCARQMQGLFR
jgi:hypothetical protein